MGGGKDDCRVLEGQHCLPGVKGGTLVLDVLRGRAM